MFVRSKIVNFNGNDDDWGQRLVEFDSGECVRLKNFVSHWTITGNTIEHCGVEDFGGENNFHAGDDSDDGDRKVNGEGIYIGTSLFQVSQSIS